MIRFQKVQRLVQMEIALDYRKPSVIGSVILQLGVTAMLSMLSQPRITGSIWNTLFWITLILGTITAISKNFTLVSKGRWLYWNQLSSPLETLISKMIYGWISMIAMSLINLLFFAWFMGIPIIHIGNYYILLILTTGGISTVYTFIGAIASKTGNSGFLAPVLSLPLIMPLILVGIKASRKTLNPVLVSSLNKDLMLLGALDLMIIILSAVLFQALWKD
ncbi:MAG: heme exporter protein CcmB [Bacteroidia bacterium]